MQEIKATLREILVSTLRLSIDPAHVGESDLVARLGVDSIGFMEVITQVEHRFQITVDEEDLTPSLVNSLDTLALYIAKKKELR
ncbi:MAG: acyl carrier protein [Deltaproteobacteria bacterium]|nr:acyl carrier protein [Deltaproteobacteria bacterium]